MKNMILDNPVMVTKSTLPPIEEYIEEIRSIWDSHWLTNMGEKHNELEERLSAYLQVDNISLFTNGHMALELLLQAMDLQGEVITTPFTFASTTHAIVRNGLNPVFCDINPVDYTLDVSKIEDLITPNTCAILPVHVYGNICDVETIQKIADRYDLPVIYDAAHAFGVKYKGKGIATYGDASMFSFHATKVFNTIEGGAVCFSNSEIGKILYRLKNFGIRNEESVDGIGANAKMNEFQAAMGLCNLVHIEENIEKRKDIVNLYNSLLEDIPGIITNKKQEQVDSNYAYYPIYVDEAKYGRSRNELADYMGKHNVYVRKYFYPLTSAFDCYNNRFDVNETPIAFNVSKNILTLPIYPDMDKEIVEYICELIQHTN